MPQLYEIHLLDRKEMGLFPWKYSGSSYTDNPMYFGSSCHPNYKINLANSINLGKVKKNIIKQMDKNSVDKKELRILESVWQKKENHKQNKEYYNMSDSVHPTCDNELSKLKISNTLKKKGITPFSDKTHSPESLAKAKATRLKMEYKWFYCPKTLTSKQFSINKNPPESWLLGRKPKKQNSEKIKKDLGQYWQVFKNEILIWEGQNLKKWSIENFIPGLPYNIRSYFRKEIVSSHTISRSNITNNIIFDGYDTGQLQCEFAISYGYSSSYISNIINKNRPFNKYSISEYKAVKIKGNVD